MSTPSQREPSGSLVAWEGGIDLVLRRRLAHPVADVWRAVVEKTGAWFSSWEQGPGEDDVVFEDGPATILDCVPAERLLLQFGDEEFAWRNGVTLEDAGGATLLTLTHGFDPEDGEVDLTGLEDIAPGWEFYLDRLAAHLDGSPPPEFEGYGEDFGEFYVDLAERGPGV